MVQISLSVCLSRAHDRLRGAYPQRDFAHEVGTIFGIHTNRRRNPCQILPNAMLVAAHIVRV